jgi:SAM-dependent methyltransferase
MTTEYSDAQYASNYPDGVERHWWNLVRNRFILQLVRKICRSGSRIIEIGCGRGVVVEYLRNHGVDCVGVELAAVEPMRAVLKHVQSGISAFDLPYEERARYDAVLLLDVLEHLPDPRGFLDQVLKAYPNARRLIVTVPGRPELWSNYDVHYGHYRRYTLDDLDGLFQDPRLRLSAKGYFFHGIYLPALLLAKAGRDRAIDIIPPKGWGNVLHRLIAFLLMAEAYLVPARCPGTSAFAVSEVDDREIRSSQ